MPKSLPIKGLTHPRGWPMMVVVRLQSIANWSSGPIWGTSRDDDASILSEQV